MKTRCPYLDCCVEFEVPDETRYAECSACGRKGNVRDVKFFSYVDKQYERLYGAAALSGESDPADGGWRRRAGGQLAAQPPLGASPLGLSVLLENIRSLWNVGSIFRTADGAGFNELYLCGITGCPPRKEIAKTSLGAEDVIPWQFERSALHVLPELKKQGVTIVGLERTSSSQPLSSVLSELSTPLCLVLGNEVTGITLEALEQCDFVCDLPMRGMKESLNVAVAFGIAAYAIADSVTAARQASHCDNSGALHDPAVGRGSPSR